MSYLLAGGGLLDAPSVDPIAVDLSIAREDLVNVAVGNQLHGTLPGCRQLRSGGGAGAGLLGLGLENWYVPSSPEEESQSKPMHLVGDLEGAAVEKTGTAEDPVASCFVSLEAVSGVQPGGGETPALHTSALPWRSSFQNACITWLARNGCGKYAETHT